MLQKGFATYGCFHPCFSLILDYKAVIRDGDLFLRKKLTLHETHVDLSDFFRVATHTKLYLIVTEIIIPNLKLFILYVECRLIHMLSN